QFPAMARGASLAGTCLIHTIIFISFYPPSESHKRLVAGRPYQPPSATVFVSRNTAFQSDRSLLGLAAAILTPGISAILNENPSSRSTLGQSDQAERALSIVIVSPVAHLRFPRNQASKTRSA